MRTRPSGPNPVAIVTLPGNRSKATRRTPSAVRTRTRHWRSSTAMTTGDDAALGDLWYSGVLGGVPSP